MPVHTLVSSSVQLLCAMTLFGEKQSTVRQAVSAMLLIFFFSNVSLRALCAAAESR